jgi:hypothetical protein
VIPLYVVDIARQHAAAHPGQRGAHARRLALAAVVIATSCTVVAAAAASFLR